MQCRIEAMDIASKDRVRPADVFKKPDPKIAINALHLTGVEDGIETQFCDSA